MVIQQDTRQDMAQQEAQQATRREQAHARGARNIRLKRACAEVMRLLWPGVAVASVCRFCGARMELIIEEPMAPLPFPAISDIETETVGAAVVYSGERFWGCPQCGAGEWERYSFVGYSTALLKEEYRGGKD
ncbi:MAG: hypothetical protein HY681_15385 [Chloroflexi bacterium]|nr:hypothetical protein [Chloroflexota bacterium]